MIKLSLIEDKAIATRFQREYYKMEITGTNVALLEDGSVIGLLTYSIGAEVRIKAVYLQEDSRGKGLGDFLIRATLNFLTNTKMRIIVEYPDERGYYLKFGFTCSENELSCRSEEVIFPSKCGCQ